MTAKVTVDMAGIRKVVRATLTWPSVRPYSRKCPGYSAIARCTPQDFLAWREAWPGSVVGTRLDATVGYRDAAYARPSLILMGNEQAGLTDALAAACDVNVKIPMRGRADSLNLAVATGIMIYAVTG